MSERIDEGTLEEAAERYDIPRLSETKKALLQAILYSGIKYGLELIDWVKQATEGQLILHQGSAYPALRSLERDGFLTSFKERASVSGRGGRPRVYYELTALGHQAVEKHERIARGLYGLH